MANLRPANYPPRPIAGHDIATFLLDRITDSLSAFQLGMTDTGLIVRKYDIDQDAFVVMSECSIDGLEIAIRAHIDSVIPRIVRVVGKRFEEKANG